MRGGDKIEDIDFALFWEWMILVDQLKFLESSSTKSPSIFHGLNIFFNLFDCFLAAV